MAEYTKGNFKCVYEDIAATDDRHRGKQRIVSVEAQVVRRKTTSGRGAAPDPLIGSMKAYLAGAPHLLQIGMDNGHLIGLSIGGIDTKHNIAPMVGWFNEVSFRSLERDIYGDETIKFMRVQVAYDTTLHAIPTGFAVYVKRSSDSDADLSASPYVMYTMLPMRTGVPEPYPMDADIRKVVEPVLPSPKPTVEPYAFLDKLGLVTPTEASEFTELQKSYILTANALYSHAATGGGYFLRSDDPTDPVQTLDPQGGANRPQIDHVIPRSTNGSNSFRNAMVLSKKLNGIKSAKIDEETMAVLLAARDKRPSRSSSSKAPTRAEVGLASRKKTGFPY